MVRRTLVPNDTYDYDLFNPVNWNPNGTPEAGDQLSIFQASVVASGTLPANVSVGLASSALAHRGASLTLKDATVPAGTRIEEITEFFNYDMPSSLLFAGTVTNNGTLRFSGDFQRVDLPTGAALTNNGIIDIDGAAPRFFAADATASFVNNGLIRVTNTFPESEQRAIFNLSVFNLPIAGTGTISVSANALLELNGTVTGQKLQFVGGADARAIVQIDQPGTFAATIGGFVAGDTISLANTAATSINYVATAPDAGTLQILNGASTPVASLSFSGVYTAGAFTLTQSGTSLLLTTPITDATIGTTATPTARGIFRFFDNTDGTHFFTASVTERDRVLIDRPDLTQETNGFGAVTTADPTTAPVYRFFDTVHGTHFFTASQAERDQITTTRTDLAYEPTATFQEYTAPQPGSAAVYRFFSTADGTHLYTASASERTALTTPGTTLYRPDLVAEGIGFYAPTGTYA